MQRIDEEKTKKVMHTDPYTFSTKKLGMAVNCDDDMTLKQYSHAQTASSPEDSSHEYAKILKDKHEDSTLYLETPNNQRGTQSSDFLNAHTAIPECNMRKIGIPPRRNDLYFEQQVRGSNHCQAHAINNVFGDCIVTPESLKKFIQIQYRADPSCEGWLHAYDRGTGFSDSVIIQWLKHNNLYQTRVHAFTRNTTNICALLSSLASRHNCEAFLCRNHHHAFAIKKFRGTWKLLDSLNSRPVDLNPSNTLQPFTAFKLSLLDKNIREEIAHPNPPYTPEAWWLPLDPPNPATPL
eukprot:1149808-Pelagomonas_calceolata.AAC.1